MNTDLMKMEIGINAPSTFNLIIMALQVCFHSDLIEQDFPHNPIVNRQTTRVISSQSNLVD